MALPSGQRKVWEALIREYRRLGVFPNPAALAGLLRLHPTTVNQHVEALEHKGLLETKSLGKGRARLLWLTLEGKLEASLGIPLLGRIQAGPLSTATQEIRGLIRLPGKPGYFGLEISGQSMSPWLQPGDITIVKNEPLSFSGQVAVVRHHDETTLKRVFNKGRKLRLESVNPEFAPFTLAADEAEVQAVYSSHFGGELTEELLEVFM